MQLIDLAMDRGDMERADHIIQDALDRYPKNDRLTELGVQTAVALSDWDRAIDYLTRLKKYGSDSNLAHDRRLACTYILRAQHKTHPLPDLKSAHDLAGYLGPITARYADQLMVEGRVKKAEKILSQHWADHPSLEVADSWMNILTTRNGNPSATDRHQWTEELTDQNPNHPASHRILTKSAMAAELYGLAATHLEAALQAGADAELYRLKADLAKQSDQDLRSADHYLQLATSAPPAPHWICQNCGNVMDEWEPICAVCDGFDMAVHTLPTAQNRLFLAGQTSAKNTQKNKLLPLPIN
jgi:HemY protein